MASTSKELKKSRRKFYSSRLPTPPPDPTLTEDAPEGGKPAQDPEFLEYLNCLQKNPHPLLRSESLFAPVTATEDAFDHLDKLYKLMQQMLDLREQNVKLQRRIRDLEHLRILHNTYNRLGGAVLEEAKETEEDVNFAESLLDNLLTNSKRDPKFKLRGQSRLRQSLLKRPRDRSSSIATDNGDGVDKQSDVFRRASAGFVAEKPSKVSKWTKVKAAFRWEKASPTVSGAKSQDSGIGGILPNNYEVARYLRVPSTSDDAGISPADSGAADGSTPGTLSSASSNEELSRRDQKHLLRDDVHASDDDRHSYLYTGSDTANKEPVHKTKLNRTPWAKVKNIIPGRTSVKQKHRLSTLSDDVKLDISIGSDNEDVFEPEEPKIAPETKSIPQLDYDPTIPLRIIERYQQALAEDEKVGKDHPGAKSRSRWTRVKKAFLTSQQVADKKRPPKQVPYIPTASPQNEDDAKRIKAEIQKNYQQLQNQLSLEFQGKLMEWEKLKSNSSSPTTASQPSTSIEEHRKVHDWQKFKYQPSITSQSIQLLREENLPPDFKKKLQEWQKMKKTAKDDIYTSSNPKKKLGEWPKWKSVSGNRSDLQLEHRPLSEDFLKKLETWKQIKTGGSSPQEAPETCPITKDRTPSPNLVRKNSGSSNRSSKKSKEPHQKELHWFEKELNKIEKEKQRLERERQKFLEREERLTNLRRSIVGDNDKQDVLIEMPSGSYRFEGISKKFTQKLYEWEKAQGIRPEASTFALLTSQCSPKIELDVNCRKISTDSQSCKLYRSKSADSLVNSSVSQALNQLPSSLSLNDVEELEKACLAPSRECSTPDINFEIDEPEAVIVEVEDIIEETASPLDECLQEQHFPIYQRQEYVKTCEEEACVAPKVERSESTRAYNNHVLIQESIKCLSNILENENKIIEQEEAQSSKTPPEPSSSSSSLKESYQQQCSLSEKLMEKLSQFHEINLSCIQMILKEKSVHTAARLSDVLETVQDVSTSLLSLAEKLNKDFVSRNSSQNQLSYVRDTIQELNSKLLELKRILSYVYAASDITVPGRKKKGVKKALEKQVVGEEKCENTQCQKHDETVCSVNEDPKEDGAVRKRNRFKQKGHSSKRLCGEKSSDDETDSNKTPSVTLTINKTIPSTSEETPTCSDSPVTVFVKTTRKLFTPIVESSISHDLATKSSPPPEVSVTFKIPKRPSKEASPEKPEDAQLQKQHPTHLPPLPPSPIPQRKFSKDISPSIRVMLAKYNQKISEQESASIRSGGSSGSASPVAWRSPVSERRLKAHTDRYLEEVNKLSPKSCRKEVQKSATVSVIQKELKVEQNLPEKVPSPKGILRSISAGIIKNQVVGDLEIKVPLKEKAPNLKLTMPDCIPQPSENPSPSIELRYKRLQKAKEEFMNSPETPASGASSAPPVFPGNSPGNRLSQASVGSESSYEIPQGLLVKSASAGMINIDPATYKQFDTSLHRDGYVSLPRSSKKGKEGFFGGKLSLSNIAAKFRKVKMRRSKDSKMNAVSTLCRQSLIVDINSDSQDTLHSDEPSSRKLSLTVPSESRGSSSEDASPSSSRSGSWIQRHKFFHHK